MNPVTEFEVRPLPLGGGVTLRWINPTDAAFDHVKILRKITNDISGPTDPGATVIHSGVGVQTSDYRTLSYEDPATSPGLIRGWLDSAQVAWVTTYYYAVYATDLGETAFSVSAPGSGTTPAVGALEEIDVVKIVMDFLKTSLAYQVSAGTLVVKSGTTIDVLDAPPRVDQTTFPVVSLHLDQDQATEYALGDILAIRDASGDTGVVRRGYLSTLSLSIVGWAGDNPDVRRSLYRAMKALLVGARAFVEACGVVNPTLSGRYDEDFETYQMPMFMAAFTLTGSVVTSVIVGEGGPVKTIDVNEMTASLTAL